MCEGVDHALDKVTTFRKRAVLSAELHEVCCSPSLYVRLHTCRPSFMQKAVADFFLLATQASGEEMTPAGWRWLAEQRATHNLEF